MAPKTEKQKQTFVFLRLFDLFFIFKNKSDEESSENSSLSKNEGKH